MMPPVKPLNSGTKITYARRAGEVVGRTDYSGLILYHIVLDEGRVVEEVHIGDLEYAYD